MHKVLLVDDEMLICSHLKNDIDAAFPGRIVSMTANSARQALELLERENPDIMIVDIRMPDMDGLKLIEIIRMKNASIHLIILSGHDDFRYAQRAMELGVCMYLLKPINKEKLIETLSSLCQSKKIPGKLRKQDFNSAVKRLEGTYCVVAAELGIHEKKDSGDGAVDLFLSEADAFFPKQYLFFSEQKLLYFLIPCADSRDVVFLEEQIGRFLMRFEKAARLQLLSNGNTGINFYVYVGIAEPSSGSENLRSAKKSAESLLEYCYFSGHRIAPYYKTPSQSSSFAPTTSSAVLKKEVAAILYHSLTGNTAESIQHLEHFFDTNFRYLCRTRLNFLMECNMFYLLLGLVLEENGFSEMIIPTEQVFQTISAMESYGKVLAFFKQEMVRISNQVNGVDLSKDNPVILKIKQYVMKNYRKNISLSDLSQTIYLSSSYLSTYFKKQTGQTISDYTIMVRIEQAKRLLIESDSTVNQIAEQVGYPGYRYFSTLFKNVTGVTPIHYRLRRLSQGQIKTGGKLS